MLAVRGPTRVVSAMAKSGHSPQATRRRVWRFVFGCLVIVLAVALWPLKGYRIDGNRFLSSVGPPHFGDTNHNGDPENSITEGAGACRFRDFRTAMACRDAFEYRMGNESQKGTKLNKDGIDWNQIPEIDPNVFAWSMNVLEDREIWAVGFFWYRRNVLVEAQVLSTGIRSDKSPEQVVREAFGVVRDGIDREIPGVTTFYNPPARQLYYDRVRPFLAKHFPKAFAP